MDSLRLSDLLRPDFPASFDSLNDDTLDLILQFVGRRSYATYAGLNKRCKDIYLATKGMTKETFEEIKEILLLIGGTTKEEIIEECKILAHYDYDTPKNNKSKKERFSLYGCGSSSTPVTDAATIGVTEETFDLCKEIYFIINGITKETFLFGYGSLADIKKRIEDVIKYRHYAHDMRYDLLKFRYLGKGVVLYNRRDILTWALEEKSEEIRNYALDSICIVAVKEGRIDILNEVYDDMNDDDHKESILVEGISYVASYLATRHDKLNLNVLKWFETKGLYIDKTWCAKEAAKKGQFHILKWLQEEKGLKLFGELYTWTIRGGQLHVMKWLREQKVPWDDYTFRDAAEKGNLEVLQWLHNEGCPWDRRYPDYRVSEKLLKTEVLDWCRVNGYGDRVYRD